MMTFLAIIAGALTSLTRQINAALSADVGSFPGSLINHIVGVVFAALLLCLGLRADHPPLTGIPWAYFCGGILGMFIVAAINSAVRVAGALTVSILMVATQLLGSAIIDQWGLLGGQVREITPIQVLGLLLLVVGVIVARERAEIV